MGTPTWGGSSGRYDFVAWDAWYVGDEPYRRPQGPPSTGAFSTSLTITFDDDPDHKLTKFRRGFRLRSTSAQNTRAAVEITDQRP